MRGCGEALRISWYKELQYSKRKKISEKMSNLRVDVFKLVDATEMDEGRFRYRLNFGIKKIRTKVILKKKSRNDFWKLGGLENKKKRAKDKTLRNTNW